MSMVVKDWINGAAGMMLLLIAVVALLVIGGSVRWLIARKRKGLAKAEPAAPLVSPEQERQRLDRIKRPAEAVAAAPSEQRPAVDWPISESLSVVLRRQVPVRFDQPARSWLGGLPCMPEGMEWPRAVRANQPQAGPLPLHFVAQIACADLPGELWDGLGPREGWLLFFCDGPDAACVLHTLEAGAERQPPADIGPVDNAAMAHSPFFGWMTEEEVPTRWRRWPVDCIAVPNSLIHDADRVAATPPDFAAALYSGEAVCAAGEGPPPLAPFTWRPVLHGWDALGARVAVGDGMEASRQPLRDRLASVGGPYEMLLAMVAEEEAAHPEDLATLNARRSDPATDAASRAALDREIAAREACEQRLARIAGLVERYPDMENFSAFLDRQEGKLETWRQGAPSRVAALDAHMSAVDPDSPLPAEDWEDIAAFLKADRCAIWRLGWASDGGVRLERRVFSLWAWFETEASRAAIEIAGDYATDPQRHALIPDHALAVLEPWWRSLAANRPHRIGGYHDGLRSQPVEGPTRSLLLLQLASDPAMQWTWGDGGAAFWFIGTGSLSAGRFGTAACHWEAA